MITFLSLMMVSLIATAAEPSFRNEPNGFRNLAWGTPLDERFGARREGRHGPFYERTGEENRFGDLTVDLIEYHFHDQKFSGVYVDLTENCEQFKRVVRHRFGPPTAVAGQEEILTYELWNGDRASVRFVMSGRFRYGDSCSLSIRSAEYQQYLDDLEQRFPATRPTAAAAEKRLIEDAAADF